MKKVSVYQVTVSTGDRSSKVFGYFTSRHLGLDLSKNKGWYGENGSCNTASEGKEALTFEHEGESFSFLLSDRIIVVKNKEDFENKVISDKKAFAMAKLSLEDKQALGLA